MSYLTPSNQLQEALLQFQEAFKNQGLNTRLNETSSFPERGLVKYLFANRYSIKRSLDETVSSVPNESCKKKIASIA